MSEPRNSAPFFLDHVRFHKSDAPVGTTSPPEYFDQTLVPGNDTLPSNIQESGFEDQLLHLEKGLGEEKLNVSKKDALLLSAVARDARRKHIDINWDHFLPSLFQADDLRTTIPASVSHHESGSSLMGHTSLDRHGVESPLQRGSSPCAPKDFPGQVESIIEGLQNEKLSCAKESLVLIQNARKCDVYPNDTALCFDATLRPYQKVHELDIDILLSPMNSSQLYSPSASPEPRISPDQQNKGKEESSGQTLSQFSIPDCEIYPKPHTTLGPSEQRLPIITLDEDIEPSIELPCSYGPSSGVVYTSIEPNHEPHDVKYTNRVPEQNELICPSVENIGNEGTRPSISHPVKGSPYFQDHDAPQLVTVAEVPVDNPFIDNISNQKGMKCSTNKPNHKLRKRGDKLGNPNTRKHQCRPTHGRQEAQEKSTPSSPLTALGSLTAFMETRGKICGRRVNAKSPYFAAEGTVVEHFKPAVDTSDTQLGLDEERPQENVFPTTAPQYIPGYAKSNQKPIILYMSISLLKSHLSLVRILESQKQPKRTLVYRDYGSRILRTTGSTKITHGLQNEADIIVSPSTGIILTTSQATTQLYLPGHKPSHPQLEYIKDVNSPLRERIMLAAPRYEQLYIFMCHSSGAPINPKSQEKPGLTADKRTLDSTTALIAFCSSISGHSTVTPLLIAPSNPEIIAEWVLSLAHKHAYRLPAGPSRNTATAGFTSINQDDSKTGFEPAQMETETQWELFLCRSGLNPFAAQAVLAVLRMRNSSNLSEFIEMSTEQRKGLFAGILGDKVLNRIEAVIEKDWQCDWALDFDAVSV